MSQLQTFSNAPVKASSIIGTNVVNPKGDSLGDIKEVVIAPVSAGSHISSYRLEDFSAWEKSCSQSRSARLSTTCQKTNKF